MTNKEIAKKFNDLGAIMELYGENQFKIRSYRNAYNTLRKVDSPLVEMTREELSQIKGVGNAIADKIIELGETGELQAYRKYADKTPPGIIEMLSVRGFGPKKIKVVWKELDITTIGELLYACNENRLIELKGFGEKTQNQLIKQLQYFVDSQGKYLYGFIIDEAQNIINSLRKIFPGEKHALTGGLRQMNPIVEEIEILTTVSADSLNASAEKMGLTISDNKFSYDDYPIVFYNTTLNNFGTKLLTTSSPKDFIEKVEPIESESEEQIFEHNQLPYIPAECREMTDLDQVTKNQLDDVVKIDDIRGVIHAHSTYSDGIHTIEEMAKACIESGYEYLVMSDHSKIAVYANGLNEDRVFAQFEEIDELNNRISNFRIFKSIEADILSDGSMDYGDGFLQHFDLVIASIHSGLRMDINKATDRIIKAVENPNTHILGHPTGRLLLSREGYPLDHMKVIDACAANGMAIELNANPLRLDLDWTWIPYALEKGVMISINPDSHNKESIRYIQFGVNVARKAMLPKNMCLNTKSLKEFTKWVGN